MTETAVPTESASGHASTIERYVRFWNAEFAGDQRRLAAMTFTDDVEYHAPIGDLRAAESLIDFRNEFAGQMGAVAYRLREEPDVVGDRARVRWEIRVGDDLGTSFAEGTDVLVFGDDGRIISATTFLDRAPEGFDPHGGPAIPGATGRTEGRW
jgi:hypothetical protein